MVLGASPVALALAELAAPLGFQVTLAAPRGEGVELPVVDRLIDGFAFDAGSGRQSRFVVVSTQGKGDEAALRAALDLPAAYRGFVGSRRKMTALETKLAQEGADATALDTVKGPAGLDFGAITPEEIALSILSEITALRRKGQRQKD